MSAIGLRSALRLISGLDAGSAIKGRESACFVSLANLAASSNASNRSFGPCTSNHDADQGAGSTSDRPCSRPSPWDSARDPASSLAHFRQHQQHPRSHSVTSIQGTPQPHSPSPWHQQFCTSASSRQHETPAGSGQGKESSAAGSSSGATDDPAKEQQPLTQDVYYEGPLSKTHKMLKLVSISNTVIACAAAPLIVMYADISYVSRVGLASSLVIFGLLTTGALHWITNPYVHELKFSAATQQIDVRTVTLLGGHRWHSFQLSDVKPLPWDRPVATFMAKDRFYYIDVYSFPDEELLKRLTPDEATVPKGYKDDEDD